MNSYEPDFIYDHEDEVLLQWRYRDSMMSGRALWTIKEFSTSFKDPEEDGALIVGPDKWAVRTGPEGRIEWFDNFYDALELTIKEK